MNLYNDKIVKYKNKILYNLNIFQQIKVLKMIKECRRMIISLIILYKNIYK